MFYFRLLDYSRIEYFSSTGTKTRCSAGGHHEFIYAETYKWQHDTAEPHTPHTTHTHSPCDTRLAVQEVNIKHDCECITWAAPQWTLSLTITLAVIYPFTQKSITSAMFLDISRRQWLEEAGALMSWLTSHITLRSSCECVCLNWRSVAEMGRSGSRDGGYKSECSYNGPVWFWTVITEVKSSNLLWNCSEVLPVVCSLQSWK